MTYEETREYLLQNYFDGDDNTKAVTECDCETEAMKIVIECIEKQIPKKPLSIRTRDLVTKQPKRNRIVLEFQCPCCKDFIICDYEIKRCIECGQAIDWSDEE